LGLDQDLENLAFAVDGAVSCARSRCPLHFVNQDYDHAIADYNEAIRLDPKSAYPVLWRYLRKFLQDAVDDYKLQYDQSYITSPDSTLKHIDPELYRALEQWSDRPELQRPEGPEDAGL
jgi:hypothetical protein